MKDVRLEKLAKLIVNYSLALQQGEKVLLKGSTATEPLLTELYRESLKAGAHPEVLFYSDQLREILLKEGTDQQLEFISPLERLVVEKYDASVWLWGDYNTRSLSNVDPQRISRRAAARKELSEIQRTRESHGEYRWCGTQFPTHSDAQEANMSLEEYTEFVFATGLLDKDDPISEWRKISDQQQKIVEYLNKIKSLRIVAKDTDLTMSVAGRRWINCDGKYNFPDGEIFTAPVENSVQGHIRFSFPGIYAGQEIEDIYLEFTAGKVSKAKAAKGENLLLALLDTDAGSRSLGEIAIGTNYGIEKFTRNMLFDEKIGGTVHAALGDAPPETLGTNSSSIHWDMLCDMRSGGKIFADGELIYADGRFIKQL